MSDVPMQTGSNGQDDLMLQYLLEMGALSPQQAQIARQRKMVDMMREQAQVPSDTRNAGRFQVARNPLEMLAPVAGQFAASMKERSANKLEDVYKQSRLSAIDRLRTQMAQRRQPGATPTTGDDVGVSDAGYGYASPL